MILDTNALSSLLAADRTLLQVISRYSHFCLPVIVLGEYRFGLAGSRDSDRLGRLLDEMEDVLEVLALDRQTVRPYASLREQLKVAGTPIPSNDIWIAALAVQHQQPIVSRDAHFDVIAGVTRVSW